MAHYERALALSLPVGEAAADPGQVERSFALAERTRARSLLDLGRANRKLGMGSIAHKWLRKALGEARDPKLLAEIEAEIR